MYYPGTQTQVETLLNKSLSMGIALSLKNLVLYIKRLIKFFIMEIILINPDVQSVRILGAGGVIMFKEDWMKGKTVINYPSNQKVKKLLNTHKK
jgi:hypothetical protein